MSRDILNLINQSGNNINAQPQHQDARARSGNYSAALCTPDIKDTSQKEVSRRSKNVVSQ